MSSPSRDVLVDALAKALRTALRDHEAPLLYLETVTAEIAARLAGAPETDRAVVAEAFALAAARLRAEIAEAAGKGP